MSNVAWCATASQILRDTEEVLERIREGKGDHWENARDFLELARALRVVMPRDDRVHAQVIHGEIAVHQVTTESTAGEKTFRVQFSCRNPDGSNGSGEEFLASGEYVRRAIELLREFPRAEPPR